MAKETDLERLTKRNADLAKLRMIDGTVPGGLFEYQSDVTALTNQINKIVGNQVQQSIIQTQAALYNYSAGNTTSPQITKDEPLMIDTLIKGYTACMLQDVRSPILHLAGPPGANKSTTVQELGAMLGVTVHTLNVSRISPLEIEGIQMPVGSEEAGNHRLSLLHASFWTGLKDGDIVLLEEFLRGFPEVYNGLLDIMTSREVAGLKLPKVFFVAASNSVAAYDKALEDRLLHIFVPDLRKKSGALSRAKWVVIDKLGLNPKVHASQEMSDLFSNEVLPMYDVLDQFNHKAAVGTTNLAGSSVRKLIGQAQMRVVESKWLKELIEHNNRVSMQDQKYQYVLLVDGNHSLPGYEKRARQLVGNAQLTEVQANNLTLNLQLIEMEEERKANTTDREKGIVDDDVFE